MCSRAVGWIGGRRAEPLVTAVVETPLDDWTMVTGHQGHRHSRGWLKHSRRGRGCLNQNKQKKKNHFTPLSPQSMMHAQVTAASIKFKLNGETLYTPRLALELCHEDRTANETCPRHRWSCWQSAYEFGLPSARFQGLSSCLHKCSPVESNVAEDNMGHRKLKRTSGWKFWYQNFGDQKIEVDRARTRPVFAGRDEIGWQYRLQR